MSTFTHLVSQYGSYALAPFGLAGMIMTGRKNRKGWALSICTQVLWLTYGVVTAQWGFVPGSGSYLFVYVKNFIAWKPRRKRPVDGTVEELSDYLRYLVESSLPKKEAAEGVMALDELLIRMSASRV